LLQTVVLFIQARLAQCTKLNKIS